MIDFRVQALGYFVRSPAFTRLSARRRNPTLLLAGSNYGVCREPIVNELVYISLDKFAVNDPGFFHQHVAL